MPRAMQPSAAPAVARTRETVDPRDRVRPIMRGRSVDIPEFIEAREARRLELHLRTIDRKQLKLGPKNQSRQAEPADRRRERLGRDVGPADPHLAIRPAQRKPADMAGAAPRP